MLSEMASTLNPAPEKTPETSPVPEHGDPLANRNHLLQPVGDEKDGGPPQGQFLEDFHQFHGILPVQSGGGFVEQQDFQSRIVDLACDLHELLHADGKVRHAGPRVQVNSHALQDPPRLLAIPPVVEP